MSYYIKHRSTAAYFYQSIGLIAFHGYIIWGCFPTFGKFTKEYFEDIQSISKNLKVSSTISLQHKWEDRFRELQEALRPDALPVGR